MINDIQATKQNKTKKCFAGQTLRLLLSKPEQIDHQLTPTRGSEKS